MKIGVYPFASTSSIADNLSIIERAISTAATKGIRLLAFHECALCGYPPIESDIAQISAEEINSALARISYLSFKHHMYIAVGTVRFEGNLRYNSIVLFDDHGTQVGCYDKTALWGWDCDHFIRGSQPGIFEIDGIKIGFRICFDVRFPELFRSLYRECIDLCIVAFSDTSEVADPDRYAIIKSHLISRAAENTMTIISVNSLSRHTAAPTAVFDPNGHTLDEYMHIHCGLMLFDFSPPEITFSMQGRRFNSDLLL